MFSGPTSHGGGRRGGGGDGHHTRSRGVRPGRGRNSAQRLARTRRASHVGRRRPEGPASNTAQSSPSNRRSRGKRADSRLARRCYSHVPPISPPVSRHPVVRRGYGGERQGRTKQDHLQTTCHGAPPVVTTGRPFERAARVAETPGKTGRDRDGSLAGIGPAQPPEPIGGSNLDTRDLGWGPHGVERCAVRVPQISLVAEPRRGPHCRNC